eukprot:tig00000692_g3223.t1
MSSAVSPILTPLAVALLWGLTNPLLKRGSAGIETVGKNDGAVMRQAKRILFLATSWRFIVPFGANMAGSALFFYTLSAGDLSIISPVTNGLTLVFTCIFGSLLGDGALSRRTYVGMAFVLAGASLCALSRPAD